MYLLSINHIDLDALYIDLNTVDTKLDASHCNANAHMVTDGSN